MGILLANAERLALDAMAEVLIPAPQIDYLAWAERNIVFSDRESPFPGPYNRELFPFFDEILRALSPEDPCRTVTIKKSAQLGGTVLGNIFTLGSLAMDPGDFLYVHPTDDNARRWSKMKLSPMLRNTATLARLFPQKSRDGSDSVLYKERIDGRGALQISGANSPASLSQVTMKRQVQDDLSKWEMNAAGDPEAQADSRSRAHEFAKVLKIGTPLVLPGCRITKSYEAGSQERLYVPCPHCRHMQVLEWANMLATLDEAKPEDACFSCIDCGLLIEEHHRRGMFAKKEWRPHNPAAMREHRSFDIWSAYSFLQSFERIAREWLKARGDPAAEQTFLNDTAGEAYRSAGEAPPWEGLRDRASQSEYARGDIPPGMPLLFIGVDVQKDRVEWQLIAWGRRYRRAVIDYGVIPGHISEEACQTRLTALLGQKWRNSFGRLIEIDMGAIDGNAWTEDVWGFARKHPKSKLIMVRGVPSDNAPRIAAVKRERNDRTGNLLKYRSRFFNFGASILKDALYRDLAKKDPLENGFVLFPKGLDDEYFRQLTAERRVPKKTRTGFIHYVWEKDSTQANEALDTMNQAETAATKWGVRGLPDAVWDDVEAARETLPPTSAQGDLEDLFSGSSRADPTTTPQDDSPVPPQPRPPSGRGRRVVRGRMQMR